MSAIDLLATGLVIDRPSEGTLFPSAGGNSADPRVQAVYWRCAVTLFASARLTNPDLRLVLFCTGEPPSLGRTDIGAVLRRYAVEIVVVPLTARIARKRATTWGTVLYFHDIMIYLQGSQRDYRLALVDSDVLVTAPLITLFDRIGSAGLCGYRIDSAVDEPINGMTRRSMAGVAAALTGRTHPPISHFGGELFGCSRKAWEDHGPIISRILDQALAGRGPAAPVLTEEHVFSIAFAAIGGVKEANDLIKRIWTSPRHNTATPGDERLPLWHLPAEKRYGLADLYEWLGREGWPTVIDPDVLRAAAMRFCGVPRKSNSKLVRDGIRQIAAKLGLRV